MKSTVKRAVHIIQTQFMDIKNIKDIANMLNCKYNSLRPHFVRYTGRNMVTYLNEIRCMYAKKIIQTTDWKNYRIAKEVGFSSESYFKKVFNKLHGKTPSEIRNDLNT